MFECIKDWTLNGETYFLKGIKYKGKLIKNGFSEKIKSVEVTAENGKKVCFHTGSDYFKI